MVVTKLLANKELLRLTTKASRGRVVYLLGTAHVSKASVTAVRELIAETKPKVVFIELCEKRRKLLQTLPESNDSVNHTQLLQRLIKGEINVFAAIYALALESAAKKLETKPGAEFIEAAESATSQGAEVFLGDRDVDVTIQRVWKGLKMWQKLTLSYNLLLGGVYSCSAKDISDVVEDMKLRGDVFTEAILAIGMEYPWLVESLVRERDLYMVYSLHRLIARLDQDTQKDTIMDGSIVAVVGAGHMDGMKKLWDQEESQPGSIVSAENIRTIMRFPSNSPLEGIEDVISISDLQKYAASRSDVVREKLQAWKNELDTEAKRNLTEGSKRRGEQ